VVAGLALLLVIAALVAGRVYLGSFLPGLLGVGAILIIGVTLAVRSGQSGLRKAVLVTAMVLVVALAVPASLRVVYPLYHHFFEQGSSSASASSRSASPPSGGGPVSGSGSPSGGAPVNGSGILVQTSTGSTLNFGYIDPNSGQYTQAVSFSSVGSANDIPALALSPDLTKYAITRGDVRGDLLRQTAAGWIDTSGNFTAVSPLTTGHKYYAIGFDAAGNFYYQSVSSDSGNETFKVQAGTTTNPEKLTLSPKASAGRASLSGDGTVLFGCGAQENWLGPNTVVSVETRGVASSSGIADYQTLVKVPVTGRDEDGCPVEGSTNGPGLLPENAGYTFHDSVVTSSPDGSKLAFVGQNGDNQGQENLYILAVDGNSQPAVLNTSVGAGTLTLVKWS
jgi:hypothetical protein